MLKSFQKSAKSLRKLDLPHPGIIDGRFDEDFILDCYEPSPELIPFVSYIWVQRPRVAEFSTHVPIEIMSGPSAYLFITSSGSFVHAVGSKRFEYDPGGVVAGVKFRPGGFYSFAQRPLASHVGHTMPASEVFSELTTATVHKLLRQPDGRIVATLDTLLCKRKPVPTKHAALIAAVIDSVATGDISHTVPEIARHFGVSERTLQLIFHTYVGVGLKWMLARQRLLRAVQCIQTDTYTSRAEMAVGLGYSSQSHFTREFTRVLGISPSQYMRTRISRD